MWDVPVLPMICPISSTLISHSHFAYTRNVLFSCFVYSFNILDKDKAIVLNQGLHFNMHVFYKVYLRKINYFTI